MSKLKLVDPPKPREPEALGVLLGIGALVQVCWTALKGALSKRKDS